MLKPGDSFTRYRVEEVIGSGGMGTVYRAFDTSLERQVALKVISEEQSASPEANARLVREARAAAALNHQNAVSIFDVGEVDDCPFIVMELISGRTLREAIGESAPLERRVEWLEHVAEALGAAHQEDLVHRDIKPENVMVRDDGVVKVLDFGIARRPQSSVNPAGSTELAGMATLTREGVRLGTPIYMSPEQIKGDPIDSRSDQFAWGVLAFELTTGRLPWQGDDPLAIVARTLTEPPDRTVLEEAGVTPAVAAVILRTLAKEPDSRFESMQEVLAALREAHQNPTADGLSTGAHRYSTVEVRDILARAVERQAEEPDSRLAFDELLAAAREVGVQEHVLREASREVRGQLQPARATEPATELTADPEDDGYAVWRRRKRRGFLKHLGTYLIVNVVFLVLAIIEADFHFIMPALIWAIGLGLHGMNTLMANRDDYEAKLAHRQRRELRRREWLDRHRRAKKRHDETIDKLVEEGASLLLATGARLRTGMEGKRSNRRRERKAEKQGLRLAVELANSLTPPTQEKAEAEAEAEAEAAAEAEAEAAEEAAREGSAK